VNALNVLALRATPAAVASVVAAGGDTS